MSLVPPTASWSNPGIMWSLGGSAAQRARGWAALVVALSALLVVVAATASAVSAQGALFPSFLSDPYASYSSVELADWSPLAPRLQFPDRLVQIGDTSVGASALDGAFHQRLAAALTSATAQGLRSVPVVVEHQGELVSFVAPIRRIGRQETLVFFVNYLAAGILHLWLALLVLATSPPGRSVFAYVLLSVGAFGFLATFFDYHTSGTLAPLFHLSGAALISGFLLCAYCFPDAPRQHSRRWGLLVGGALLCMSATGAALLLAPYVGMDSLPLRVLVTAAMPASILVLATSLAFRWRRGGKANRDVLRRMLPGFLIGPAATAVGFPLTLAIGGSAFHVVLPCASLVMTGSLGMALVRTNVFRTTAVLRSAVLLLPATLAATYVGTCIWLIYLDTPSSGSLEALAIVASATLTFLLVYQTSRRLFFRATYLFRPALESLGRELSSLEDPVAIEAIIRKRLEEVCTHAKVRLMAWDELVASSPPDEVMTRIREGHPAWLGTEDSERARLLPIGRGEGDPVLVVTQKEGFALHTTEDVALMDAMVVYASLALKSAQALRESTVLRRIGVQSALNDKELTLSTLFAEVAHELAYPLSYFRFLLARAAKGTELSPEDCDVGQEEVARLERMLKNLRARKEPDLELEPVCVLDAVRRAVELIRADARFSTEFEVCVPPAMRVRAGRDQLLQLLANLIRNAASASPPHALVVIRAESSAHGANIQVEDRGEGVPEEMREKIFNTWVSGTRGGSGLGLTTCQRIALRFGWGLNYERTQERSIFRLSVPPSGVSEPSEEASWKS